jgi:hypothetical protein
MARLAKPADELVLQQIAGMVGGEGDAHEPYLACNAAARHSAQSTKI